jgi:hypothetical protein
VTDIRDIYRMLRKPLFLRVRHLTGLTRSVNRLARLTAGILHLNSLYPLKTNHNLTVVMDNVGALS